MAIILISIELPKGGMSELAKQTISKPIMIIASNHMPEWLQNPQLSGVHVTFGIFLRKYHVSISAVSGFLVSQHREVSSGNYAGFIGHDSLSVQITNYLIENNLMYITWLNVDYWIGFQFKILDKVAIT